MSGAGAPRRAAAVAATAAVLGAGALLLHSAGVLHGAVQVWRGYYTMVVSSDSPSVLARLDEAGLAPVVAAARAREPITTFRGTELVPVAGLELRLDPLDPRYDPYLRRVGEWFAAGPGGRGARIVYVASTRPPVSFAVRAARALSGTGVRWQIAGLPWRSLALALLLYTAAAVALIVPRGGALPRRRRVVLGLPWLFLVAHGGLPAAFVAVPAHAAAVRVAGFAARRPARAGGTTMVARAWYRAVLPVAAAGVAAVLAAATAAGPQAPTMALSLAAGSLWCAALAACTAPGRRGPVAATPPTVRRTPPAARLVGAAALAAVTALLMLPPATPHVPRPAPVPGAGDAPSAGLVASLGRPALGAPISLAALMRFGPTAGDDAALPVLADYVTHLAYQQTLAVGRPYRLPAPDERVIVNDYRRTPDGRVLLDPREVARFTEEWLAAAISDAPDDSIASLLAAQGRLVTARRAPPAARTAGQVVLWIFLALLLCAWIVDPLPPSARQPAPRTA